MKQIAATILVLIAVFGAQALTAAPSDLYVVPIAGHVPGANATAWRTDLVLYNPQPVAITIETALIESGRPPAADAIPVAIDGQPALQLQAGETRVVADVLGSLSRDVMGALVVGASMPFVATSRTYAEHPGGRTLGQTVLPNPIASAGRESAETVLAGIGESDRLRSNLGAFIAASRAPFVAEIELVSAAGAVLGTRVISLDTEGFLHRQFSSSEIGGNAAAAIIRVLEGDGIVVPYASLVDNGSAEALFLPADTASSAGAAAHAMLTAIVTAPPR